MPELEKVVEGELIAIERTLWTNDAPRYEATYLPDAVLIFPEVGRLDRDQAVAAIQQENAAGRRWAEVAFESVRVLTVAPEVALLTYEAMARWNDEKVAARTLCATLYVRRESSWRVAFHQQTTA